MSNNHAVSVGSFVQVLGVTQVCTRCVLGVTLNQKRIPAYLSENLNSLYMVYVLE